MQHHWKSIKFVAKSMKIMEFDATLIENLCNLMQNHWQQRYFGSPGRLQTKLRRGRLNYVGVDRAGKFCVADAIVALPKKNSLGHERTDSCMNGPLAIIHWISNFYLKLLQNRLKSIEIDSKSLRIRRKSIEFNRKS